MTDEKCCRCAEPHENWPTTDGGLLCQGCWEAASDLMFWDQVPEVDRIIHRSEGGATQ